MDEQEQADRVNRLADDLLAERLPDAWDAAEDDDIALARIIVTLKAGNADRLMPDPTFVSRLGAQLRAQESAQTEAQPPGAVPPAPAARLPRRRMLGGLVASASGLLLGGLGGRAVGQAQAEDAAHAALHAPYAVPLVGAQNGEWITVAHAGALQPGAVQRFEAGALIGYLSYDGRTYSAVSAICSHMGCLLRWDNPVFVCPCHGALYRRTGRVLDGVSRHPLPTIDVRVLQSDEVQVYTTPLENTRGTGIEGYPEAP